MRQFRCLSYHFPLQEDFLNLKDVLQEDVPSSCVFSFSYSLKREKKVDGGAKQKRKKSIL